MNFYWEKQQGNNCRIHSLNAMFGRKVITEDLFGTECDNYDKVIPGLVSRNMDGFAECRNIVSYIVDKYTNQFSLLIPLNYRNVSKSNRIEFNNYERYIPFLGTNIQGYFEFNKDHIWYNRFYKGEWYKIDSLSGITKINKLRHFSENGYFLLFSKRLCYLEIEFLFEKIKKADSLYEIYFYNLYHIIKRIKLEYCSYCSEYNKKISLIRLIYRLLTEYIELNRMSKLDMEKISHLILEIQKSVILFF